MQHIIRQQRILLDALLVVAVAPPDPTLGICPNYQSITDLQLGADWHALEAIFQEIATKWPHYSGNAYYPVPAVSSYPMDTPRRAYALAWTTAGGMWGGEYGKLRKDLLQFAISELKTAVSPG